MNDWVKFALGWLFIGLATTGGMEGLGYKTSTWDVIIWPRFIFYELTVAMKETIKEAQDAAAKEQENYNKAVYRDYYYRKDTDWEYRGYPRR